MKKLLFFTSLLVGYAIAFGQPGNTGTAPNVGGGNDRGMDRVNDAESTRRDDSTATQDAKKRAERSRKQDTRSIERDNSSGARGTGSAEPR